MDGNRRRFGAELAHDAAVAILMQRADYFGRVAEFVGLEGGASTIRISLFAIGMSTGPRLKNGWPKASTCLPSL